MKTSKQINFYLTSKELLSFDKYLMELNSVVIGLPLQSSKPKAYSSIIEIEKNIYDWPLFFRIMKDSDLKSLIIRHVKSQEYYLINTLRSPVIEVSKCSFDKSKLRIKRGRLFYQLGFYNDKGEWVYKNSDFLE